MIPSGVRIASLVSLILVLLSIGTLELTHHPWVVASLVIVAMVLTYISVMPPPRHKEPEVSSRAVEKKFLN